MKKQLKISKIIQKKKILKQLEITKIKKLIRKIIKLKKK